MEFFCFAVFLFHQWMKWIIEDYASVDTNPSKDFRSVVVHWLQVMRDNYRVQRTYCLHKIKGLIIRSEWVNWLSNVTINDISVIYVAAHRCAGGLKKKLDLRSGSQRHRHFVGFFNVPVLAPTRDHPFYTVIPTHRPI